MISSSRLAARPASHLRPAEWAMAQLGQSLQVLCRRARCEVRFDPKTDLILTPNPVATCLLRKPHYRRPSS
jgi:hypothetical protein